MRTLRNLASNFAPPAVAGRAIALSDRRYPLILVVAFALIGYQVVHEFRTHEMGYLYLEYLANYDFGFIRRGLVGEVLSRVRPRLTHFDVKIFAVAMLVVTLGAYVAMYARRFGLTRHELPLFVCAIASPAVFKNFAYDFGRLDILGFLGAVVALWLPVNGAYALALGAICCVLIVMHEGQFFTFVPVIATIAALRLLARPDDGQGRLAWREAIAVLAVLATAGLVVRFGGADVPPQAFLAHIQARAVDPVIDRIVIWYTDPWENMRAAASAPYLWDQLRRGPKYLLVLLAHVPLLVLAYRQIRSAPLRLRAALWVGFAAATAGTALLCMIGHDRARFVANWLAGSILIIHAVRLVQPQGDPDLATLRSQPAVAAAWLLAVLSRIGLMTP